MKLAEISNVDLNANLLLYYCIILVYTTFWAGVIFYAFQLANRLWKLYCYRMHLRKDWPSPKHHWFWGHLGLVTKGNTDPDQFIPYFTRIEKDFPIGFTIYSGPFNSAVMIHHPELIKLVLGSSAFEAPKSTRGYNSLIPWLGRGLLVINNQEWFHHRRLLTSAFHFEILKPYIAIMNNSSTTMVKKWLKMTENGESGSIEIFEQSSRMTLDTILQSLMSYKSDCQNEKENDYITSIYRLSRLLTNRQRNKNILQRLDYFYYKSDEGKQFKEDISLVHHFSESLITKRKNETEKEKSKRDYLDFLDMLLKAEDENGKGLSDSEIRAEVDTFMFEGHDTTASGLSWSLYCLACNPEHQRKCYEEIKVVLGDRTVVKWTDLPKLAHLNRCVKETLRIYPPVPNVLRILNKDIHFREKTLVKGTFVQISLIGSQRHVEFWENPEKFNPDRFNLNNVARQHSHAYVPFSAGHRNCIGQNFALNEIKIALVHAIQNFKFLVDPKHKIIRCNEVVYRTRGGLYLITEKRA